MLLNSCTRSCQCLEGGRFVCEDVTCNAPSVCELTNGAYECTCGEGRILENGRCVGKLIFVSLTVNFNIWWLKGYCTPNQNLAWFVLYLKIINTFLKNSTCMCILKGIVQGTQNSINIYVDQAGRALLTKTIF